LSTLFALFAAFSIAYTVKGLTKRLNDALDLREARRRSQAHLYRVSR
jgi:hypothetical protein